MTPRFSAYVKLKTLSFNTLLQPNDDPLTIGNQLLQILNSGDLFRAVISNLQLFKTVGLAENVTIDETYNSRPFWGIGEPANPIVIPNNYSANISISRLTLDTLSIRDFTTLPDYWYVSGLQRKVHQILGPVTGRDFIDYPFYTFLYFSSIEGARAKLPGLIHRFVTREIYVFMPSDYSTRVTSGDTIILTDVRGTGKLLDLRGLIEALARQLLGGD